MVSGMMGNICKRFRLKDEHRLCSPGRVKVSDYMSPASIGNALLLRALLARFQFLTDAL